MTTRYTETARSYADTGERSGDRDRYLWALTVRALVTPSAGSAALTGAVKPPHQPQPSQHGEEMQGWADRLAAQAEAADSVAQTPETSHNQQ